VHDTLTVLQRDEVYGNPDWTLAIFFRDPLERLLSGYINKCVEPKWRDSQCMPTVRTRGRRTCRRCTASLKGDAGEKITHRLYCIGAVARMIYRGLCRRLPRAVANWNNLGGGAT
jgi:hypothetical protein